MSLHTREVYASAVLDSALNVLKAGREELAERQQEREHTRIISLVGLFESALLTIKESRYEDFDEVAEEISNLLSQ